MQDQLPYFAEFEGNASVQLVVQTAVVNFFVEEQDRPGNLKFYRAGLPGGPAGPHLDASASRAVGRRPYVIGKPWLDMAHLAGMARGGFSAEETVLFLDRP